MKQESFEGTIRLSDISDFHFTGIIGICLFAKHAWKKGYASEAVQGIIKYPFEVLGLRYLEAGAYKGNSINLFKSSGFFEHFIIRNKYRLANTFSDVVYLAIHNKNFNIEEV